MINLGQIILGPSGSIICNALVVIYLFSIYLESFYDFK